MSQAKRVQFPRELLVPEAAVSTSLGPITVKPGAGHSFDFGGLGVQWKIDGRLTDQLFAVVHHPLAPRVLAAPLHYHRKDDELSYVVNGNSAFCWVKRSSSRIPGRGYSSRVTSGTRSGTTEMSLAGSSRSSPAGFENYFRDVAASWGDVKRLGGNKSGAGLARNAIRQCARAVPTIQCDLSFA